MLFETPGPTRKVFNDRCPQPLKDTTHVDGQGWTTAVAPRPVKGWLHHVGVTSQAALLSAGLDAINRADWKVAEGLFREGATLGESPEALDGLATQLWWQGGSRGGCPVQSA